METWTQFMFGVWGNLCFSLVELGKKALAFDAGSGPFPALLL